MCSMTEDEAVGDPVRPGRLLLAERDALMPILRRTPADRFDRASVCEGWVTDAATLIRLTAGRPFDARDAALSGAEPHELDVFGAGPCQTRLVPSR
jgi:hypothetical protein